MRSHNALQKADESEVRADRTHAPLAQIIRCMSSGTSRHLHLSNNSEDELEQPALIVAAPLGLQLQRLASRPRPLRLEAIDLHRRRRP